MKRQDNSVNLRCDSSAETEDEVHEAARCVRSGSVHQGARKFRGNNSQCCAMAAVAAITSVFTLRRSRNLDIDFILDIGDQLYMQIRPILPPGVTYLRPEDLPSEIRVGNFSASISPMTANWIANGLFATDANNFNEKTLRLINILQNEVFTSNHCDDTDSIIFTGQSYTVSFWRHRNAYYLFNSHGVDCNNRPSDGVARLFKCRTLMALVDYLFARRIFGGEYSLDRLRVVNFRVPSPTFTLSSLDSVVSPTFTPLSRRLSQDLTTTTNTETAQLNNDLKLSYLKPVVVVSDVLLKNIKELVGSVEKNISKLSLNNENVETSITRGRPKKQKRGRKPTKNNSHLDAVKKYTVKNPDVNREAVKRYAVNNPDVNREAVKRYAVNNPDVNREAVKRYAVNNPDVNREAVKHYSVNNPEIHREAVKRYSVNNPDVNREAVKRYSVNNPEIHREAVKRYSVNNPETHREAVQRYSVNNPEINREASQRYNTESRNVDVELRRSTKLIGEYRDAELDAVRLYSLKKPSLLALDIYKCPHCGARLFEEERGRKQWCCGAGANNVQNFKPLNEDFYSHPLFLSRPRAYNNMFAFSALGVSHGYQHPQQGLSFLKIQGRIYHRVFDLSYQRSTNNIGLYVNDSDERERLALGQNLDLLVIRSINQFLHNVNPYIDCFKRLSQEPSDEAFIRFERTTRATHGNILGDLPIGSEIAAIISTERENYTPRCIAVWKIGASKPHQVDIMHPLYEAFQYPLLYPEGEAGWFPGKLDNRGIKLTQVRYVRCLLLSETRFSEFLRLSEEWLVDMYCRITEERLRFIANMQNRNSANALRTAPLNEVNEILRDETVHGEGFVPGRVYLPSTFTGGPRYMKVKYMDAIAIVNRLGTPSYFLTITCNPKWPEIQQSCKSSHRYPLICARAFNLRLHELLRDIRSGRWFGKCVYMFHVIEFQKRGLPHAHICFKVDEGPIHNVDIDKFVRADIPNSTEAGGRLRKAVLDHMIHGPCGPDRANLPCWDNEKRKCLKFFPKRETNVTFVDDKGFVNLRRSSENTATITYRSRDVNVNDQWVVPYNAGLLLKYDAHLNLEVSSQRTIVKYLFKYMTKGPDESRVAIVPGEHENDEVEQYVTKRYIGSSDAAWRTLEFDVTAREPTVKQLSVHLEHQQSVYFRPGTEEDAAQRSTSDLLEYFARPAGERFDGLTYLDFYEQYRVHASRPKSCTTIYETANNKFVTERQRGQRVARLFWVGPNRGEQFYLRLLLTSHPCRSYADLLKLGGPNCTTFQEAAKTVGLADDEVEYERAMLEASSFYTGPRLRSFFVLLASNGAPVALLWDTFKNQLSEDFLHRLSHDQTEMAHNLALIEINRMLLRHGTSVTQHGLPEVVDDTTELGRERVQYSCERLKAYVDEWLPRLSSDQRVIFNYVNNLCTDDAFRDTKNCAIFVDGPAGTGKTLLLNVVTAHVRGVLNNVVLCTASSAIAAQNYEGGTTAHSMFKFPIELVDDISFWSITNGSQRADLIYNAQVLIYDEAPMAHKFLIHILDRSLRDLMRNDKIFGGKIIIFAGDFRQIPPVITNARSNSDILNCSIKTSPIWNKVKSFSLITSQRCRDDPDFSNFLLKLGSNLLPSRDNIVNLNILEYVTQIDDLINFVFSDVIDQPDVCARRAILCTHNAAVKEINNAILNTIPGLALHFFSVDKSVDDNLDPVFFSVDALNRMQPKGVPEHDLVLKIGCVCMITRNLSFADGLVNGTKVIVVRTSPRLITVRKPGGSEDFFIPRILFKTAIERNSAFEMCRRQFPLQLSYAMTIHKSQGQTISRVGVDLRSDIFSHGQLYVALGRVRDRQNIKILVHPDKIVNNEPVARNVIISELL